MFGTFLHLTFCEPIYDTPHENAYKISFHTLGLILNYSCICLILVMLLTFSLHSCVPTDVLHTGVWEVTVDDADELTGGHGFGRF